MPVAALGLEVEYIGRSNMEKGVVAPSNCMFQWKEMLASFEQKRIQ